MPSNVLITGSSGFIGQALVRTFSKSTEFKINTLDHKSLSLLPSKKLIKKIKDINPEYIFHLAAYGNHSSQTDDGDTFIGNVINTYQLLDATRDIPYKAFINIGSSSEYGSKQFPMNERDLPEATTMYGCTKVAGTYLCRAFAKKYDKPIVTVRPFSVYGPGEAQFRFIPTVIKCLVNGDVLKLEESSTHDWIYIDDFIDALGAIAEGADLLSGQVVNIGTGREMSNLQIVQMLEGLSDRKAKIESVKGLRTGDSEVWKADITKMKNVFKWEPQTSIVGGLLRTYQYYKDLYGRN